MVKGTQEGSSGAEQRPTLMGVRGEGEAGRGVYMFVGAGGGWSILWFLHTLRQSHLRKAAQAAELAGSLGSQRSRALVRGGS